MTVTYALCFIKCFIKSYITVSCINKIISLTPSKYNRIMRKSVSFAECDVHRFRVGSVCQVLSHSGRIRLVAGLGREKRPGRWHEPFKPVGEASRESSSLSWREEAAGQFDRQNLRRDRRPRRLVPEQRRLRTLFPPEHHQPQLRPERRCRVSLQQPRLGKFSNDFDFEKSNNYNLNWVGVWVS